MDGGKRGEAEAKAQGEKGEGREGWRRDMEQGKGKDAETDMINEGEHANKSRFGHFILLHRALSL